MPLLDGKLVHGNDRHPAQIDRPRLLPPVTTGTPECLPMAEFGQEQPDAPHRRAAPTGAADPEETSAVLIRMP